MTPEIVVQMGHQALEVIIVLLLLLLMPALLVGLIVSMFQAATQINEMTLSFIPKLLVTFLVIMFGGPWMLALMVDYMQRLFASIPSLIG